jgi:hypothetical protein
MTKPYIVGLDPGVTTGFAVWNRLAKRLEGVMSGPIHEALWGVDAMHTAGTLHSVIFEDARLRTWYEAADKRQRESGAGVREGIGSVKRDCKVWEDFLTARGITFFAVRPQRGMTKWSADTLRRITGWTARTNNHGRDAAALCYGRA